MFQSLFTILLASLFLLLPDDLRAAVVTIDGTIKSVDATKRTITVQTKTETLELDVSRKAKVSVKGKTAKLDSLKPGQKVKISYHDGLEIVLKIEAASNSPVDKPKLIELSEINSSNYTADPWLSRNGLTIYWVDEDRWIWTASRENSDSFFETKKRLVKGTMPTVSLDGLEMIFVSARGDGQSGRSFFVTTRKAMTDSFLRPKEIAASLQLKFPCYPCLSADGLTIYFGMVDGTVPVNRRGPNVWISGTMTRRDKKSAWSSPKVLPLKRTGVQGKLTWIFPSDNGLSILCAREGSAEINTNGGFMIWTRDSKTQPFVNHSIIQFEGIVPLIGRSPRYCEKTMEFIFVRDLRHEGNNKFALWMVKGVTLNQFTRSK